MSKDDSRRQRKGGPREAPEFDQTIIDLARVTRVMAGGKRMRFRACVAIGKKNGEFGVGTAKGRDVTLAVNKAVNKAKKNMIKIPIVNKTIPHEIYVKYKAAKILLKPAPVGTGVKAGGALRSVLELAGVPNVVGKIIGTNNKITNVQALIIALSSFKKVPERKVDKEKQLEKKAGQAVGQGGEKKQAQESTNQLINQ